MYQKVALVFFTVIFYTGCDNSKSKSKVSIEKTESIILPINVRLSLADRTSPTSIMKVITNTKVQDLIGKTDT
mgnify:CR=1 FL=1